MRIPISRVLVTTATAAVAVAAAVVAPAVAHAATAPTTVTVTADAKRATYGDADPAFTYSVAGLASGDRLTRTPTCTVTGVHTAAGSYPITCSGAAVDTSRYKLAYASGTLSVAKATVTVTADPAARTTAQPDPAFTYKVTGLKRSDALTRTPTCTVPGTHSAAGSYPITCSGADAGTNYAVAYVAGTLKITAAPRGTVYVYGNYAQKFYGTDDPALTYTTQGLPAGTTLRTEPTCTVAAAHRAAGDYPITCSGAVAPAGYDVVYLSSAQTVLRVLKAPLSIYADGVGKTYGAADPAFTYEALGLRAGDALVTKPTCGVSGAHADVGDYRITCSGADAGPNYAIAYADNADTVLRVSPAPLYVGAYDRTSFYGAADPTFAYLAIGLQGKDGFVTTPTCGVGGAHVHPGTYPITCSGGDAGRNYTISYAPGSLEVRKAPTALKAQPDAYGNGRIGTLSATLYAAIPWPASRPVAGATITFSTGGTTLCTAVTDQYGTATCSVGLDLTLLNSDTYTATYAGTDDVDAASDTVKSHG